MKNTLFLSATLAAIVYSSCIFANSSLSKDKDDGGNTTLSIHFDNKEAKEIYKHLEYARELGGYVVSDSGMSKNYLSSPVITCYKTDPTVSGLKPNDDPPGLYICDLTIGVNGLKQNP
ncbi:MAG: hypothetical protein ACL7BU_14955 [Candidatus Phlomobacter fragariae]